MTSHEVLPTLLSEVVGHSNQFGEHVGADLSLEAGSVTIHGALGKPQEPSDLCTPKALCNECQDLHFAARE